MCWVTTVEDWTVGFDMHREFSTNNIIEERIGRRDILHEVGIVVD